MVLDEHGLSTFSESCLGCVCLLICFQNMVNFSRLNFLNVFDDMMLSDHDISSEGLACAC